MTLNGRSKDGWTVVRFREDLRELVTVTIRRDEDGAEETFEQCQFGANADPMGWCVEQAEKRIRARKGGQ